MSKYIYLKFKENKYTFIMPMILIDAFLQFILQIYTNDSLIGWLCNFTLCLLLLVPMLFANRSICYSLCTNVEVCQAYFETYVFYAHYLVKI